MDRNGIATALTSISAPGFWFGDAQATQRLCRHANDYAAGLRRDHPKRFGVFASLPLPGNRSSLVWTEDKHKAPGLLALDEAAFNAELSRRFGNHLGATKAAGPRYDNRNVRAWQAKLEGLPQRAHAAHLNSFEAFPFFAAAVLAAIAAQADMQRVAMLSIAFVVARALYGLVYLWDVAAVRSLVWFAGLACVIGIFASAIRAS